MTNDERPRANIAVPAPILVIGLGNPILGDDGVGWRVAEEVKRRISNLQSPVVEERLEIRDWSVEVDCVSLGGLSLMERMMGYDHAIVIDAVTTGRQAVGSVTCCALEDLPDRSAGHTTAAHDTSPQPALRVGRAMGAHLPDRVMVVAVEANAAYDFSEALSLPIADAVPRAATMVLGLLKECESIQMAKGH